MSTIPTVVVRPSAAAEAYARTARSVPQGATQGTAASGSAQGGSFGATVQQAIEPCPPFGRHFSLQTTAGLQL